MSDDKAHRRLLSLLLAHLIESFVSLSPPLLPSYYHARLTRGLVFVECVTSIGARARVLMNNSTGDTPTTPSVRCLRSNNPRRFNRRTTHTEYHW